MNVSIHTAWEKPDWKNSKKDFLKRLGYYTAIWDMLDSLEEKEQTQEV